jgi:hypothetical protein
MDGISVREGSPAEKLFPAAWLAEPVIFLRRRRLEGSVEAPVLEEYLEEHGLYTRESALLLSARLDRLSGCACKE